jgi:pimeloyl-ACP methyl ester carboxylesterase
MVRRSIVEGWGTGIILALFLSGTGPTRAGEQPTSVKGLVYDTAGNGSAVVLLHGSNLDRRMWDRERRLLTDRWRVIRYDLRGHGASESPTESFSPAADLEFVLDAVAVPRASLVGLSAGAAVAIEFALEHPDRVEQLILASPSIGGYRPEKMPDFFAELMGALQAGEFGRANEVLLASPLLAVPEDASALVADMVRGNEKLWTIPPHLVRPSDPPAIERLSELGMPITVVVGGADLEAVLEQGELICKEASDCRLRVIEGGGHLINLTSPDAFHEILVESLEPRAARGAGTVDG